MSYLECQNCQRSFEGKYCSNCGQRFIGNKRLKMREVIDDFLDNTFNLHKGFFFTFWNLIVKPGYVAQSYINGQRKMFTNPTRYMVIALAFQTFIDYWFKTTDVIENETYYRFSFLSDRINDSMEVWNVKLAVEYILLSNMFMILLIPALLYLVFRELNYNYTELLIVSFYFIPTILFITMPFLFVTKVIFGVFVSLEFITFIFISYLLWSHLLFFRMVPLWLRLLKILMVVIIFMITRILLLPFILSLIYPLA